MNYSKTFTQKLKKYQKKSFHLWFFFAVALTKFKTFPKQNLKKLPGLIQEFSQRSWLLSKARRNNWQKLSQNRRKINSVFLLSIKKLYQNFHIFFLIFFQEKHAKINTYVLNREAKRSHAPLAIQHKHKKHEKSKKIENSRKWWKKRSTNI